MLKTALENFDWLHPLINYSQQGYRLCGLIPLVGNCSKSAWTIYWLFERTERLVYDYCLIEYQLKSSSLNSWTSLLTFMAKQDWRLVGTLEYTRTKKTNEQVTHLLFFQKFNNE
jgi:hypothetical protein